MKPNTSIPAGIEKALLASSPSASRRDFLKTSGMLVVSVGAAALAGPLADVASAQGAPARGP